MIEIRNLDYWAFILKSLFYLFIVGSIIFLGIDGLFYWLRKWTGIWVDPEVGQFISVAIAIGIAYFFYKNGLRTKTHKEIIRRLVNRGISISQQLDSSNPSEYIKGKDIPFAIALEEYKERKDNTPLILRDFSLYNEAKHLIDEIKSTETYKKLTRLNTLILKYLPKKVKNNYPKETYFFIVNMCDDLIRAEKQKIRLKYEKDKEQPENNQNMLNFRNNILNEYYGTKEHPSYSLEEIQDFFDAQKEKEEEEETIKQMKEEFDKEDDLFEEEDKKDNGYSDKYCTKCGHHLTMDEQYHDNKYCHKCYLEQNGCKSDLELNNKQIEEQHKKKPFKILGLAVDSTPSSVEMIQIIFQLENYGLIGFQSGASALANFKKGKYDIAFIDIKTDDTGDFELLKKLKEKDPNLDIVIFTLNYSETIKAKALELGAIECIDKLNSTNKIHEILKKKIKKK